MTDLVTFLRSVLAFAALLGALGLVTWRQSRALEGLERLDEARNALSIAHAERIELQRRIQMLESRARIVPLARERLGMHTPGAAELVLLPGGGR